MAAAPANCHVSLAYGIRVFSTGGHLPLEEIKLIEFWSSILSISLAVRFASTVLSTTS